MKVHKDGKIEIEAADMPAANELMIQQAVMGMQLMPDWRSRMEEQAKKGDKLAIEALKRLDAAPALPPEVEAFRKAILGMS